MVSENAWLISLIDLITRLCYNNIWYLLFCCMYLPTTTLRLCLAGLLFFIVTSLGNWRSFLMIFLSLSLVTVSWTAMNICDHIFLMHLVIRLLCCFCRSRWVSWEWKTECEPPRFQGHRLRGLVAEAECVCWQGCLSTCIQACSGIHCRRHALH